MHIRCLQQLVTAIVRVSLWQRMQLVLAGYQARFAEIGVVASGDLAYLKVGDLAELGLPSAAHAVLVQCVEKGFCKPPIAVEVSKSLMELQTPIRVCGLGAACWSCTLFQLPWHVS